MEYNIKDSGERRVFSTGAVRDSNEGKPRYDLISPYALKRLAFHMAKGAAKYKPRNWEKGQSVSVYWESLQRHMYAWAMKDDSEDHLSAALFNIMAIIDHEERVALDQLPSHLLDYGASELKRPDKTEVDLEADIIVGLAGLVSSGKSPTFEDLYARVCQNNDNGYSAKDAVKSLRSLVDKGEVTTDGILYGLPLPY